MKIGSEVSTPEPITFLSCLAVCGSKWPLSGPVSPSCQSPGNTDLRPVHPGVKDSQGRWPCAGLQPAKLSSDTLMVSFAALRGRLQLFDLSVSSAGRTWPQAMVGLICREKAL